MSFTTESIIRIVKAGGNLSIDVEGKTTEDIIQIIDASIFSGKKITLRNLYGKSPEDLIHIVRSAADNVTLEI